MKIKNLFKMTILSLLTMFLCTSNVYAETVTLYRYRSVTSWSDTLSYDAGTGANCGVVEYPDFYLEGSTSVNYTVYEANASVCGTSKSVSYHCDGGSGCSYSPGCCSCGGSSNGYMCVSYPAKKCNVTKSKTCNGYYAPATWSDWSEWSKTPTQQTNSVEVESKSLTVVKKPTIVNDSLDFTGESVSPVFSGFDSISMNISGNSGISVGCYTAKISLKSSYIWDDETNDELSFNWQINKRENDITYILNDDGDATNSVLNPSTYIKGDSFVLADPVRPNYEFMGWSPEGVITETTDGDLTFTANWREVLYKFDYEYFKKGEGISTDGVSQKSYFSTNEEMKYSPKLNSCEIITN